MFYVIFSWEGSRIFVSIFAVDIQNFHVSSSNILNFSQTWSQSQSEYLRNVERHSENKILYKRKNFST